MQNMAVYVKVHGTGEVRSFLRLGTLAAPASFWGHEGETINVLLQDGTFAKASLTTPLSELLNGGSNGVAGQGSELSPICICIRPEGAQKRR